MLINRSKKLTFDANYFVFALNLHPKVIVKVKGKECPVIYETSQYTNLEQICIEKFQNPKLAKAVRKIDWSVVPKTETSVSLLKQFRNLVSLHNKGENP